ncbi:MULTISPECIES: biotin carboxylase N-terminal domain-containing protein [unclassified Wenzhouxiangella]|uniref:ATP-binding protein n=1 Tax=unclassified Wenzhouxiangella TaxID=2613841 RepID=UPI000E3276ED|nr:MULTISPECIES: biotin carboxylase N-terminal domain-containing protein [unclassified Wenzhouxiangella]RFF26637.1 ATP-grasp domain-containing protein [Wenzhouxiangella sp. 15181]RFP67612.1 ATP-grasp domain-containing protein [Wenzhouxiangella sp. 15190]
MFKTVLIANRGEIACRIIATCRHLGVETVAVYSDADANARHVRLADRAVHIGAAAARESYLDVDRIIQAAKATGAQAIHPGYGFLAENVDFARKLRDAGVTLIGPTPETMDLMGSKAAAKAKMEAADVPLIPGYHGDDQDDNKLMKEAERVGFPLMLKAAAGGGGKGMRVVHSKTDFEEALKAARREAAGAFGDERMIIERYLPTPRHIEAQVFADTHGHTVHLFERDCSSQRRHQKIIEEAPAAKLDDEVRQRLLAAAVRAAAAVDYVGAGTVEFLVDGDEFFFLEMNTRLQVEHPVTECITGLDLVEWQLRVAAGEQLPLRQNDIRATGHAMEARIYAEDPDHGFVPSTGRIDALALPETDWVRIDSGVDEGDEVSMHYDPMIAKLIVHDSTREACLARLNQALAASFVAGPTTNLGFLQALAGSQVFTEAAIDTGLLDRELSTILEAGEPPLDVLAAAAGRWLLMQESKATGDTPWDTCDSWRLGEPATRSLDIECADKRVTVEAIGFGGDYRLQIDDETHPVRIKQLSDTEFSLTLDGQGRRLQIHAAGEHRLEVCLDNRRWPVNRHARFEAAVDSSAGDGRLLAPMPGKILEIRAKAGQSVSEGETLLIMEAMKMELAIKAPMDGEVSEIAVTAEDIVEADTLLLALDPKI